MTNRATGIGVGSPKITLAPVPFSTQDTLGSTNYAYNLGQLAYQDSSQWVIYNGNASWSPLFALILGAGQVPIGTTAGYPVAAYLTAGSGVTIVSTSGSIVISASSAGYSWNQVSGTVGTLSVENGYLFTGASTATLPASPVYGNTLVLICDTSSSVVISANTGQKIRIGATINSSTAGTATNTAYGNSMVLTYNSTNTSWIAYGVQGNWALS